MDTSVALKWYLTEEHTEKAVRLLEAGTIEPGFFKGLWQLHRRGELEREEAGRIWGEFSSKQAASLYAPEDLMDRAADVVLETGMIIYDAPFVALAEGIGTVMVTADDRMLGSIKDTAYEHLGHPLSEIEGLLSERAG